MNSHIYTEIFIYKTLFSNGIKMKHIASLFVGIFLVFGLIGSTFNEYSFWDDEEVYFHINVRNDGNDDLDRLYGYTDDDVEDVQVRLFIPELGIMLNTVQFDLDDHTMKGVSLSEEGSMDMCDEWVRISVSNDEVRRTKFRQIIC